MMAEILPIPGNGMLSTRLSSQKIPVKREVGEHRESASRLTRLEAILVEIGRANFGVDVAPLDRCFHAAANGGFVLPIKTFAVVENGCFDIRHQDGPAESFRDHALADVAEADDVAFFYR